MMSRKRGVLYQSLVTVIALRVRENQLNPVEVHERDSSCLG